MKTRSDFFNDAKEGRISLEMQYRYGKEIPKSLQGVRKIESVHTQFINLLNAENEISELRLQYAALMEYDDERLTVYAPKIRALNREERKIWEEYKKIQVEYYEKNPFGNFYYYGKDFLLKSKAPYLAKSCKGKVFHNWNEKISDSSVKGEKILEYRVYHHKEK